MSFKISLKTLHCICYCQNVLQTLGILGRMIIIGEINSYFSDLSDLFSFSAPHLFYPPSLNLLLFLGYCRHAPNFGFLHWLSLLSSRQLLMMLLVSVPLDIYLVLSQIFLNLYSNISFLRSFPCHST